MPHLKVTHQVMCYLSSVESQIEGHYHCLTLCSARSTNGTDTGAMQNELNPIVLQL